MMTQPRKSTKSSDGIQTNRQKENSIPTSKKNSEKYPKEFHPSNNRINKVYKYILEKE